MPDVIYKIATDTFLKLPLPTVRVLFIGHEAWAGP